MAVLEEQAHEMIKRHRMLPRGAAVIAALSGGADSMALLFFLKKCCDFYQITLSAAHLNHGLRGAEAVRDESFVRRICKDWGVPLTVGHVSVREQALQTGEGLEACGRRLRYAFLESLDPEAVIATAHTLSDQAETMLLHLTRGTGLRGLCGIPPVRGQIIRPLLTVTREEVEAYCGENEIEYILDSSNSDRTYSRNRIRLDVIPSLRELNPAFEQGIARCTESLRADELFLEELAQTLFEEAKRDSGCDARLLRNAPQPVRRRALRVLLEQSMGKTPEAKHLEAAEALLQRGGTTQLPAGCVLRVRHGLLEFPEKGKAAASWCVQADESGAAYPYGRLRFTHLSPKEVEMTQKIYKDQLDILLDCDKIKGTVVVRSRRLGDRFAPRKRNCTKSLKKLFNEAGIPPERRDMLAVLCDDEGIIFVEGFGPAERTAATRQTQHFLKITFERGQESNYDG